MTRRPLVLALALIALTPAPCAAQGTSWHAQFDKVDAALNKGAGYKNYNNASGTLAWGESYIMMSYAAMFRATKAPRYLVTLADHALAVLDQRDNKKGLKDWAGKSRPCWQASKYSANGKGYCWVVHSGILVYPMLDLVLLLNQYPAYKQLKLPGGTKTLAQAAATVLAEVKKVVATHDYQYKSGPKTGEGYYLGDPAASATVPSVAGKALPLNQMNTMGRALVLLWKATGSATYKAKAVALATYFKNRLTLKGSSYVWTYWGSSWSQGGGEDISHAAINADFAWVCHSHGLVFSNSDMQRLARTLVDNVHLSTDQAADRVDGSGTGNTYRWAVGRWLNLSPFDPGVWPVAANIFRGLSTTSSGQNFLGLANLCRYAPPVRHYTFYHVDWKDLGSYRQALKYGANILTLPSSPTAPHVLKLGYRATVSATIDQWEGKAKKYHWQHRLAKTGSSWTTVYTPYRPGLYYPYTSKKEVLFQFTDKFVAGSGIQVKEVAPVVGPAILTSSLAVAQVGKAYAVTLKGSGDAPLRWGMEAYVPGVMIDAVSGKLSWTPTLAQAPGTVLVVRLRNDSGQAIKTFNVMVTGGAPKDAGPPKPDKAVSKLDGAVTKPDATSPNADGPASKPDSAVSKPDKAVSKPDTATVKPDMAGPGPDGLPLPADGGGGPGVVDEGCECGVSRRGSGWWWMWGVVVLGLRLRSRSRSRLRG